MRYFYIAHLSVQYEIYLHTFPFDLSVKVVYIYIYIYIYIYRKSAFFHSQNIFVFSKKTKIFYIKYSKTFIYAYIRIKLFHFQQK